MAEIGGEKKRVKSRVDTVSKRLLKTARFILLSFKYVGHGLNQIDSLWATHALSDKSKGGHPTAPGVRDSLRFDVSVLIFSVRRINLQLVSDPSRQSLNRTATPEGLPFGAVDH